MSTLEAIGITVRFGGLTAVEDLSLTVEPATITALIGPNGAGKTTLFNCLTGLLEPTTGRVRLDGEDITELPTHMRARRGIGRTFQRLEVFAGMTVADNLRVAVESARPRGTFRGVLRVRFPVEHDVDERVDEVLQRLALTAVANRQAGDLPTGMLRLTELGRALCIDPTVLLLDELASGLDEQETDDLESILVDLASDGMAILLIEHDIELVMKVSESIYVVDFGQLLAHGAPRDVASDPAVQAAYIGSALDNPAAV